LAKRLMRALAEPHHVLGHEVTAGAKGRLQSRGPHEERRFGALQCEDLWTLHLRLLSIGAGNLASGAQCRLLGR
jgi:hypothetical protein